MGRLNWFSCRGQNSLGTTVVQYSVGLANVVGSLDLSLEHVELKTRGWISLFRFNAALSLLLYCMRVNGLHHNAMNVHHKPPTCLHKYQGCMILYSLPGSITGLNCHWKWINTKMDQKCICIWRCWNAQNCSPVIRSTTFFTVNSSHWNLFKSPTPLSMLYVITWGRHETVFSITSTHKHEYCYWSTFRPWSSPCKKWTPLRVMMVRQKWNLKMVESQTPPNISSIFHSHCCHCHGTGILEDLGRQISAENIHQKPVPKIWGYHCPNGQW